ncbi:trafficking protein particle complex subunit 6b-like [Heptranchias perlo]|uniref:trafficking protein particle complex subunit 6b-like n=1 Tax=Heptranchias perlo TaxID=212740 RepID=UPI00355A0A4A
MGDEAVFELLHLEIVAQIYKCVEPGDTGTYVLQDNRFRLLTQVSNSKQYLEEAPKFLAFTCGLVRGALSNLGIDSTVTAEVSLMPACKFHIVMQKP